MFTPLVLAAVLLVGTNGQTMTRQNCNSARHEAVIQADADAFIAGFFAFHETNDNGVGCGEIRTGDSEEAMQSYEAIRWALDRLNKINEVLNGEDLTDYYIPGVKIGMIANDYCSSVTTAISKAEMLFPQFGAAETECQKNTDKLMLGLYVQMASGNAMAMHEMAHNRNLPLVSYTSSAPALSNVEKYPNFMRTIPPDGPLTKAIVEFIKQLGWEYVVVVHTDNSYGREAYRAIRPYLAEAGICLTAAFPADPNDDSDATVDGLLDNVMATNTTGVIYLGNNMIIEAFLRRGEVKDNAGLLQWVVTDSVSLSETFPGQKYPRGLISVVPSGRKIIEFEDHWVRIDNNNPSDENPWYKDMHMKSYNCRLPGVTNSEYTTDCPVKTETQRRNEFVQDQYVEPAVHGVYIYARALKQAHAVLCGGQRGMCAALRQLSTADFYNNYLRDIDFMYGKAERIESLASFSLDPYNAAAQVKFEGNDLTNPSFEVFNFNDYPYGDAFKFQSVATYINELLEVITSRLRFYDEPRDTVLPFIPKSQCPSKPCNPCLGALIDSKYVYMPGDVLINAAFSVHMPGSVPLSCGAFDNSAQQGIQAMQAFIFAVNYVNNQLAPSTGRLKGVTLGALGFDDCMDPVLSNHLITEVQRYGRQITDMNGDNMLDPRTVEVFMARGLDPWMAISMSNLMDTMKRPVIGVETYTEALDGSDMYKYPYFLRAQYGLRNQAMSIVNVAKRNGWKYLQSVHHTGMWGIEANDVLKRVAAEEGICIVASYEIPDMGGGAEIVEKLRARPDVQPVVLMLLSYGFRNFMEGMKELNVIDEFQLISAIGDNKQSVAGYEDYINGMISFELWWPATSVGGLPTLEGFRQHLKNIDVKTYMTNPWMQEWFENFYGCKFNPTGSEVACGNQKLFEDFELNSDVIATIYGVFAAAQGLDETLKEYCGTGYDGLCGDFINARDKGMVLLQNIRGKTRYTEDANTYRFFDNNGNLPTKYFNYNGELDTFTYVGDYKPAEGVLYLENFRLIGDSSTSQVSSECPGVCMECLYLFGNQKFMYIPGDIIIPGIFDVHYQGDSPYSCADLRKDNGFQYTEAFRFALQQINLGQAGVKLNNVRLGGLGFDGCTDHIRASAIVTGMYSGAFPTPGSNLANVDVNIEDLAGWLSYESESTISITKILERFNVPAVTPGATSPVLDDKSEFINFFRTIPSDGRVAEAMAKLSNKLGFSYIVTLNAPEEGSRDAVRRFRMYAEDLGICIGASYEFETDGDENQILDYVLQSTTKVVAVFASPDRYIENLIKLKDSKSAAANLIFIANQPWDTQAKNAVQGSFTPIPATINFRMDGNVVIEEFLYYLESESTRLLENANPWFREYYEVVMQCNLAGTYKYDRACRDTSFDALDIDRIQQDIRVVPTMNAVYALAEGIHRTLEQKCGVNYNGVCAAFISDDDTYAHIMNNMDALSFQDITAMAFRFVQREADRKLQFTRFLVDGTVYLEGSYNKDGEFDIPLEETLKAVYKNVPSTCIGECLQCQRDGSGEEEFMYVAGDLHIAALFDVHKMGGTPYTCGEINDMHGFQLMEAFNWAMEYVNEKKGIFSRKLQGVKLGSLIFDTCSSPVRAGNLVANYHARNFEIRTKEYRIDPSLIDLYIGPMTSEASIRVADVLAEIGIPQISYGASSLELRNQRKYRYFIRTVPADDKQARALISILKKYEFPNIQLVTEFTSVGEYGRQEFLRLAKLNRICVSAEYVIGQSGKVTEAEARMVASKLREKPDGRVVVVIMDDPYTFLNEADKFDYIIGNYSFIATDKWGFGISGYKNLEGLDRLIVSGQVLTLDVETADFPELDLYLESKTPENYFSNPWFKEYYEYIHNCSVGPPTTKYPSVCPEYLVGYARAENYIQDPYALYVINAVFSTALGIDQTLFQWCGGERYYGVCNILRTHGERREYFLENIKKATFVDQTDQPFYYTADGESDRGFHVYEPQANGMSLYYGSNGYYWEDIGSYNDSHYLKMDVRYDPDWFSSCDRPGSCQCEFPEYQPSRYMSKPSPLDLNVVFISDIHAADPNNDMGCGAIDTGSSMQNLFAFLYALESVNNNTDSKFPGSLKLGGVALDTCSQPSRIGQDAYSLLSGEPVCGDDSATQVVPPASIISYMVRNSANSIATSSMLSPLKITSISMSATSVELNDKLEHAYFLRTVPPDNVQALVVAEILKVFGWDYVTVVYAENSYGRSAVQTLLSQSDRTNPSFCFGRTVSMPLDADLNDAKSVIDKLNQLIGAKVVVTFVTSQQVPLLLQATTEKGLNHRFIWIGSDTWANNMHLVRGYEETAAGAITIQIRSEYSQDFRNFVKSINFNDRKGIPDDWFEEIYQTVHQCRILSSQIQKTYTKICTGDEKFTDEMIPQDPYVLQTIISVFQIANGLSDVEACKQSGLTISSCLSLQPDRRQLIYNSILNAQHDVLPEDLGERSFNFKFTSEGFGDIGYNIFNFRRNLTSGQFEYIQVGSSAGELRLDKRLYKSYSSIVNYRSQPLSRCPLGSTCQCLDNTGTPFPFSRQEDGYVITEEGQYVDPTTGALVTIEDTPGMTDRFRDIWAIIVCTLAAIGAFAGLCMFVYLLIVYPVRGGTTVLGYMLCFAIILMYCLVFAFILHASREICGLRRFALGFVYSIAYSALFVKLVDCWRTKDKEDIYMVKYNKIGNPWGLFFSACLIVLVQVMINAEWLILEDPDMVRVIYNNKLWPRCVPDDFYDEGLILSNLFIMFLIFVSVLVGLAAFGNDKNHWDCRWIVGCVVLTIPAWMVWCLVAALGEYKMRDAAAAIGLLYNATVMLMCGPLRKLYLLNKYQASLEEEERKSQLALSSQKDYNSMYGRQYDNMPHMQDGDSIRGSTMNDDVFMYDPKS